METDNYRQKELGDFLKTRRAKISPSQVGLPVGLRRRTPGLRREEVASLAGIGITWYTWLEQGRPIQVSSQVLESLSRVLMLEEQEIIHLYTLAQQTPPTAVPASIEAVNPMLQHVLDSLTLSPSIILDGRWNILAWNKAASAIFLDYSRIEVSKRNSLHIMFTNKTYKCLFPNWEFLAKGMLARFRAACSKFIDDPWLVEMVNHLRAESREFNEWWHLHHVESEQEIYKTIQHPTLGVLSFEHTSFLVCDDTQLKMTINTPLAGTDTGAKIKRLLDR